MVGRQELVSAGADCQILKWKPIEATIDNHVDADAWSDSDEAEPNDQLVHIAY